MDPASPRGTASATDADDAKSPIFHEVSPFRLLICKIYGAVATGMIVLSLIFCLVKGSGNPFNYVVLVNLLITGVIGGVCAWWYRTGDLEAEKLWFLFVVSSLIIFQAIATDMYAFQPLERSSGSDIVAPTIATIAPNTTAHHLH